MTDFLGPDADQCDVLTNMFGGMFDNQIKSLAYLITSMQLPPSIDVFAIIMDRTRSDKDGIQHWGMWVFHWKTSGPKLTTRQLMRITYINPFDPKPLPSLLKWFQSLKPKQKQITTLKKQMVTEQLMSGVWLLNYMKPFILST